MIPKRIRRWLAAKRLDRIVAEKAASFEVQDFARRRAAAKLGHQRRRAGA